jgi:GTP-binding protein
LIEGASEGAGLGIRFLKHLTRNRVLLHIVDMAPYDGSDPAEATVAIANELARFSPTLAARERWLVLNKSDLLDSEDFRERREAVLAALEWQGPVYEISAIKGDGTGSLCGDMMNFLEDIKAKEAQDPVLLEAERQSQTHMQEEARSRIEALREMRRQESHDNTLLKEADEDYLDDDDDVEVEYVP